jgi:hypothetical protein
LTEDQAVRVYAFEATGSGKYDVQAGLEFDKPDARAVTTALGHNQLLSTNSVVLLVEQGQKFVATLKRRADGLSGMPRAALETKIRSLRRWSSSPAVWATIGGSMSDWPARQRG